MNRETLLPLSHQVFHILVALAHGDRQGYMIVQDVAPRTDDKFRLSAGTLCRSRALCGVPLSVCASRLEPCRCLHIVPQWSFVVRLRRFLHTAREPEC